MSLLDWSIIVAYLGGLVAMSLVIGRGQKTAVDYYLGSKNLSWWTVGISTMATQLGAISFVSAPAFVALQPNGGLIWLSYEFAVPVAMVFLMIFIIPVLHRANVVSIYEYLEKRYDTATRSLVSFLFQLSRGLATGVSIYAIGIVLSAVWEFPLAETIIVIGAITIIYDTVGGIKAVVYSDVLQMVIMVIGIVICSSAAYYYLGGGMGAVLDSFSGERLEILRINTHGFGDGGEYSTLAFVIGGFFLYASYYGCDQSQIQRELSTKSLDDAKRSLMFNGFARFPLVLAYCVMGLVVGAFALSSEQFMSMIPATKLDYMVPMFIRHYLPSGFMGLVLIGIIAAFMSSLDSSINSLSAATMSDIYKQYINPSGDEGHYFKLSKVFTVLWGVFCTGFAFVVGGISETVIEAINMIGSVFYGPILASFLLGILSRKANSTGIKIGVASGILCNAVLWFGFPGVHWMWWNATGFATAVGVGSLSSLISETAHSPTFLHLTGEESEAAKRWISKYALLLVYFLAILGGSYTLERLLHHLRAP